MKLKPIISAKAEADLTTRTTTLFLTAKPIERAATTVALQTATDRVI